jgi:DNA polymerase III alpha subunit (gram-positive type)
MTGDVARFPVGRLFRFDFNQVTTSLVDRYELQSGPLVKGLLNRKLLILDIEATGLDFTKEEITEIAVQEYDPARAERGESWRTYVKIDGEISPEISRLTSISKEHTNSGISVREALQHLTNHYVDHIWVAQCGFEFDFPFLERVYAESDLPSLDIDAIDPKIIFALLYPDSEETFSTNFLASHFGVDRSLFARHTAAGDVALLTEIVARLLSQARASGLHDVTISSPLRVRKFIPQPLP